MDNAIHERSRTGYVLVFSVLIVLVILVATIAASIVLNNPMAPAPAGNEETIQHNTDEVDEIWEEEPTEEEDTSPASVLHLLPENPYDKFDFQYDGSFGCLPHSP